MGKNRKNRESDGSRTIEKLKGELRRSLKEIKQLRRQVEKADNFMDNFEAPIEEVEQIEDRDTSICPKCGSKNTLRQVDLGIRLIEDCINCDYRKALPPRKEED